MDSWEHYIPAYPAALPLAGALAVLGLGLLCRISWWMVVVGVGVPVLMIGLPLDVSRDFAAAHPLFAPFAAWAGFALCFLGTGLGSLAEAFPVFRLLGFIILAFGGAFAIQPGPILRLVGTYEAPVFAALAAVAVVGFVAALARFFRAILLFGAWAGTTALFVAQIGVLGTPSISRRPRADNGPNAIQYQEGERFRKEQISRLPPFSSARLDLQEKLPREAEELSQKYLKPLIDRFFGNDDADSHASLKK